MTTTSAIDPIEAEILGLSLSSAQPPPPAGVGAGNPTPPPPPPRPNPPPVPPAPPCPAPPNRRDQNQGGFPWLLVIIGVVALAFFLLFCWAFWPGGSKKPAGPSDLPAKQVTTKAKAKSGPKKRSWPDRTGALATSVRDLDRKVESLAGEVKDLGGRVGELEKQPTSLSPNVDQPGENPLTEADLRELDEQYFDALRRRRLPE